jgi:hypothetical protein
LNASTDKPLQPRRADTMTNIDDGRSQQRSSSAVSGENPVTVVEFAPLDTETDIPTKKVHRHMT